METDPGDIMRSELSQSPKDKYYDSTNMRSLESGSSQGWGGERWGPGAEGGAGSQCLIGTEFQFKRETS